MKKLISTLPISMSVLLFVACDKQHSAVPSGPAYGHEEDFRKQIEGLRGIKAWDYKVREIQFSGDYEKALVTFSVSRSPGASPEVILEHQGFGRYTGTLYSTMNGAPEDGVDYKTNLIRIIVPSK